MRIRLYDEGLIVGKTKCKQIIVHKCEDRYEATYYNIDGRVHQTHVQFKILDYDGIKPRISKNSRYKSKKVLFYFAKNKLGDEVHFYTKFGKEDFSMGVVERKKKEIEKKIQDYKKEIDPTKEKIIKYQKDLSYLKRSQLKRLHPKEVGR